MTTRHTLPALVAVLAAGLLATGCGGSSEGSASSDGDSSEISLVAYSTPREAYEQLIDLYRSGAGAGTEFAQSYGSSGDQARAVVAGLHADLVALSLAPDVKKLVDEGLVADDWATADDHEGFVTKSVVVFTVRKGNPKNITTWDDLLRDDVEVLNPNPFTSGGARWNVMAAYGAQLEQGKSEEEAIRYLEDLYDNIGVQDKAAREALQTFVSGRGDVLLGYENEAILAQRQGEDVDYVIPDQTLLIENPVAVTTDTKDPQRTQDFVDWLRTEPAQQVFAENGYRSVLPELVDDQTYPEPKDLFTIEDVGGWDEVMTKFFDPEDSVLQRIQEQLGVSTG
jgi:sulfate/thiosulfate transport system substrate-binding protein